jgi:uncharacterized protein (DUF433 family)
MQAVTNIGTLIADSPENSHSEPYVVGTDVSVRQIVTWEKSGIKAEAIALQEWLSLAQVYAALAYYYANLQETADSTQTIVERLGGHPQHILQDAPPDLSERENRKAAIAAYLTQRQSHRSP